MQAAKLLTSPAGAGAAGAAPTQLTFCAVGGDKKKVRGLPSLLHPLVVSAILAGP